MKLEKTMISWAIVLLAGITVVAGEDQKPVVSDAAAVAKANSVANMDKDRLEKICSPDALSFKEEIDVLKKNIGSQDRKTIDKLFAALKKKYADVPAIQLELLFEEATMLKNHGWDKEKQTQLWRDASKLSDVVRRKQGLLSQEVRLNFAKSLLHNGRSMEEREEAKNQLKIILKFPIFTPPYIEDVPPFQRSYTEATVLLVRYSSYSEVGDISAYPFTYEALVEQFPDKCGLMDRSPGVTELGNNLKRWVSLEIKDTKDQEYRLHLTAVLEHLQNEDDEFKKKQDEKLEKIRIKNENDPIMRYIK